MLATTTWFIAYVTLGWIVRAGMIPTVLRRQFTPGASIAWLGIVWLHPLIGLLLYLMVGESRLGRGREKLHQELLDHYRPQPAIPRPSDPTQPSTPDDAWQPVSIQAEKVGRLPVVGNNALEFFTESAALVDRLIGEINSARSEINLLYYIWGADETAGRMAEAIEAAARRGITCRILADQYGSGVFLKSGLATRLKTAGVKIVPALPSSIWRRRDLRNHRKLGIIDGTVAFAGSHNMINPDYGGKRGAPWCDLTARFTGPIVRQFLGVFYEDWAFETCEFLDLPTIADPTGEAWGARMQAVPTGPVLPDESYRRVLLGAIQAARRSLIITTPYFVPDDPTLVSLMMAADRGVDVSLILPQTPDQFFSAAAGRAHYSRLMEAGISVHLYRPGLIHAKTMTVDETLALFGSANLDVRSFHLNFELSVLAYDRDVTDRLRAIQMNYLKDSTRLDAATWAKRNIVWQYSDSAVSLLSPLL